MKKEGLPFKSDAKKEASTAKADVVEALKKEVAKAAGVAKLPVSKPMDSSPIAAKQKKDSSERAKSRRRKSGEAASVETPKKVNSAIRRFNEEKMSCGTSSPPNAISAPTQNNKTSSATPPSDVQNNNKKKKKDLMTKSSPPPKNLAVYIEELLYELSCLELVQSESVFPFKSSHTRRLINREADRVRAQISLSSPIKSLSHLHAAPSPGVRRLTVFPEELIASSANYNSIVNNLVDGNGGYGDVSLVGRRLPRSYMSTACGAGQRSNDRFSPFTGQFSNSMSPDDVLGFSVDGVRLFTKNHKIYIPEHPSYNFIGRILGPRGNSVRRLEALTGCKILIRGKGSVKDPIRESKLRNAVGWEHLKDALHVSITAEDANEHVCDMKLHRASANIQRLLTPMFDDYKRHQLIQLAIINGTYRP
uniref:K Homology domain-containing protein n=1 Tax=Ditylenchus dipsaci TaxID=166011 RepID=A0A915DCN7_9BILA